MKALLYLPGEPWGSARHGYRTERLIRTGAVASRNRRTASLLLGKNDASHDAAGATSETTAPVARCTFSTASTDCSDVAIVRTAGTYRRINRATPSRYAQCLVIGRVVGHGCPQEG